MTWALPGRSRDKNFRLTYSLREWRVVNAWKCLPRDNHMNKIYKVREVEGKEWVRLVLKKPWKGSLHALSRWDSKQHMACAMSSSEEGLILGLSSFKAMKMNQREVCTLGFKRVIGLPFSSLDSRREKTTLRLTATNPLRISRVPYEISTKPPTPKRKEFETIWRHQVANWSHAENTSSGHLMNLHQLDGIEDEVRRSILHTLFLVKTNHCGVQRKKNVWALKRAHEENKHPLTFLTTASTWDEGPSEQFSSRQFVQ